MRRYRIDTPTATKLFSSGAWEVSSLILGYLERRVYFGYTKRAAIAAFRREVTPIR